MIQDNTADKQLVRGVTLKGATALNMIDMIGVGPFITIPLILAAMGGPQALLGWIIGAVICLSDGLVWAELGAAMPHAGGSYNYLKEIYGKDKFGRLASFLFIFQLTFSAPLSMASGCVGLAMYASYIFPGLNTTYFNYDLSVPLPILGSLEASLTGNNGTILAITTVIIAVVLLYRKVSVISRFSQFLWVGVIVTVLWIIVSGIFSFDPKLAFDFPEDAFTLNSSFFLGLGSAMLIALYDYWGYYNVNFFGGEVQNPTRNIPRAIIYSILAVAGLYIVMNISIIGVLPWREVSETAGTDARKYIVSVFMQKIYGTWAGNLVTLLVVWTAFASVFSLLMGYSRVPYAAAVEGDYFKIFSKVHPKHRFPYVSLLVLGGVAICFCFLKLKDLIAALVVIRLMVQFLAQTVGVVYFRLMSPNASRPFKMWLYPLPVLLAFSGFIYVLFSRQNFQKEIKYAIVLLVVGSLIYFWRAWRKKMWPFVQIANNK
ncbi:MAG: APC family permease [Ignavibacteria bacterium]|nr:APC family permease [Ignavibacteria bacterium]